MDKPLLKLYIIILVLVVAAVIFFPSILGRISCWAADEVTRTKLNAYRMAGTPRTGCDGTKGSVIIVMDDGFESQYDSGFRVLKQYGMKACISVIPAAAGSPGYMDYGQLAELYMTGWDMLNHTYNHEDLSALSEEKQALQINRGSGWLRGHGLCRGSDILVYPGGLYSETTPKALKSAGVEAARSLENVWSPESERALDNAEICNVSSELPLESVKAAIDNAARSRGTAILIFHKIEPVTNDSHMQVDESRLKDIAEYISSLKNSINVITFSEFISQK